MSPKSECSASPVIDCASCGQPVHLDEELVRQLAAPLPAATEDESLQKTQAAQVPVAGDLGDHPVQDRELEARIGALAVEAAKLRAKEMEVLREQRKLEEEMVGLRARRAQERPGVTRGAAKTAADLSDVWHRTLGALAGLDVQPTQLAWLHLTHPLALIEDIALIEAPGQFVKDELETRLRPLVTGTLSKELGRPIHLAVAVAPHRV